jgi:predicted metal-dependent phosphoesterase TrpH
MSFRCDLHTHTCLSDGALSPEALVERAAERGVHAIALTDHDEVAGIAAARKRADAIGIEVLAGIEISVSDEGGHRQMHILGLGIDPEHEPLLARMRAYREERMQRSERIVEKLVELGVRIDFARVRAVAGEGSIGRPHIAQALVEAEHCSSRKEAFQRYLRSGRPAYVQRTGLGSAEAIELIHAAGGIAALAHPTRNTGIDKPGGIEAYIERLVRAGLDALECHHPSHDPSTVRRLRRHARQFGLLETGGSDFHGTEAPVVEIGRGRMGEIRLGRDLWDSVLEAIRQRRERAAGCLTPSRPPGTLRRLS